MNKLDDATNILGMAKLLETSDIKEDIDFDEIEASIINRPSFKKKSSNDYYTKDLNREFSSINKRFNSDNLNLRDRNNLDRDLDRNLDRDLDYESDRNLDYESDRNLDRNLNRNVDRNLDRRTNDDLDSIFSKEADNLDIFDSYNKSTENLFSSPRPERRHRRDEEFSLLTQEERKTRRLNKALRSFEPYNEGAEFLREEGEAEELVQIIDRIDSIKVSLEKTSCDLSRVPPITKDTTLKEAKLILRMLQLKLNTTHASDFMDELILSAVNILESIFNGEREFFGKKIDLVGYQDTVKLKLRKMRYNTSMFVSSVMQGHQIPSGLQIILELLPSMFLYSRSRRIKYNDSIAHAENRINAADYKNATQDLINL